MHGSNRLGGNSLSDLLVFGRRAGLGAAEYLDAIAARPAASDAELEAARGEVLAPARAGRRREPVHGPPRDPADDERPGRHHPPGEARSRPRSASCEKLRERAEKVSAAGGRAYNPGWHLALDLRNILLIAQCVAQAALERQESRGGHTRDDYPGMSAEWRKVNLICALDAAGDVTLRQQPIPPMRHGPARAVRGERAEEVHDRRGAGRAARDADGRDAAEEKH